MIIQCAACATRFNVPDGRVTEMGTKVRCSKCSSVFYAYAAPGATTARTSMERLPPEAARALAAGTSPVGRVQTARLGTIAEPTLPPGQGAPASPKTSPFARVASGPSFAASVGSEPPSYTQGMAKTTPAPVFTDPFSPPGRGEAPAPPSSAPPSSAPPSSAPPSSAPQTGSFARVSPADAFSAPINSHIPQPFAQPSGGSQPVDPFTGQASGGDPFGASSAPMSDPFASMGAGAATAFSAQAGAAPPAPADDPFGPGLPAGASGKNAPPPMPPGADPFGAGADPFGAGPLPANPAGDPFGEHAIPVSPSLDPDLSLADGPNLKSINTPSLGNPFAKVSTDPFAELESNPSGAPVTPGFGVGMIPDTGSSSPHSTEAIATRVHAVPEDLLQGPVVDAAAAPGPRAATGVPLYERLLLRVGPLVGAAITGAVAIAFLLAAVILAQGGDPAAVLEGDWRQALAVGAGSAGADGFSVLNVSVRKRAHPGIPGLVVVAGDIENTADAARAAPVVEVGVAGGGVVAHTRAGAAIAPGAVDDATGREALMQLMQNAPPMSVAPGARVPFVAFLFDVPNGAEATVQTVTAPLPGPTGL